MKLTPQQTAWTLVIGMLTSSFLCNAAPSPSLVKDLSVQPADPEIVDLTRAGNTVFFAADDGVHGWELWKTDGTPEGTSLVKDIKPSAQWGLTKQKLGFAALNSTLLFWANDGVHGQELWRSDGTEAGTAMVKDITPDGDTSPNLQWDDNSLTMRASGSAVFFSIYRRNFGVELWKTDGTEAGTVMVKNLNSAGSPTTAPGDMFDFNGTLYFSADDGVKGRELWRTDGTEAGTVMVKDINPNGSSAPKSMGLWGDRICFSANDGVNGHEFWLTDGTPENTTMFRNLHSTGSSYPQNFTDIDGDLYFSAGGSPGGQEPYLSDGVLTWRFAILGNPSSDPRDFLKYNGVVYFSARGNLGVPEVGTTNVLKGTFWKTGGWPTNTLPVASPNWPVSILPYQGQLCLLSDELWMSDGTEEGTAPLSEQYPDVRLGVTRSAVELNGALITVGHDAAHGNALWAYDHGGAGPVLLKDIHPGTTGTSFSSPFVAINGVGYFAAKVTSSDGTNAGVELWRTDGTDAGTYLVKDLYPGEASSEPQDFWNVNGLLFFTADDGTHGRELWKSDGTEAGTVMVKDITTTNPFDTRFGDFAVVDGTLFFAAMNWTMYSMLWKSDGTEEGTVLIKDVYPGSRASYVGEMVAFQGLLFLSAMGDNVVRQELWTSDGTEAGTTLFKDINETAGSNPRSFTVAGETLYFTAEHVQSDLELWKTDGTPEGTVMVKDINPSPNRGSRPRELFAFGGALYFSADDGTHGEGLWTSDGTEVGTWMVREIGEEAELQSLVAGDDYLLFVADPGLWRSDGTTDGTRPIEITLPNSAEGSYWLYALTSGDQGSAYFTLDSEAFGAELWRTDGTDAGTQPVMDIYPGPEGSNLAFFGVIGEGATKSLLFAADDYLHGKELWKIGGVPGLRLIGLVHAGNGEFSFSFEAVMGRTYTIERSEDLIVWTALESFNDREGTVTFTDTEAAADYYYYRVTETE